MVSACSRRSSSSTSRINSSLVVGEMAKERAPGNLSGAALAAVGGHG
jgi:hypothetical protein